jgi:hypothetical protein
MAHAPLFWVRGYLWIGCRKHTILQDRQEIDIMKYFGRKLVVGAVLALLPAIPADAATHFTGQRGARVAPVNKAVFEVVVRNTGAGPDYWCGASEYARRVLGAGWKTEVYIARGRGPSVTTNRRSAVQFTIDPGAAGVTPIPPQLSLNSLKVGDHMSVQKGNSYCNMSLDRF